MTIGRTAGTGGRPRLTLGPRKRLRLDAEYDRVYAAKLRKSRGGLMMCTAPNDLPHYRLGLAVGRSAGNAVTRHRVKRLIREAFRLSQHDLPRPDRGAYDAVVAVRGKQALTLESCRRIIVELAALLHAEWQKRGTRGA